MLVVFERAADGNGLLGVGAVDGLAGMADGFLGESLRLTGSAGALSPGITVGMEAHALNAQQAAATAKFGGTPTVAEARDLGEERAVGQQAAHAGSDRA